MYLIEFLEELGEKQGSVPIGNDNSGAIAIAENKGMNAGRVRHIQARVHWIQDVIESSVIVLKKIPTKSMPADNLTKALRYEAHARHASYQKGCAFPNKNEHTIVCVANLDLESLTLGACHFRLITGINMSEPSTSSDGMEWLI